MSGISQIQREKKRTKEQRHLSQSRAIFPKRGTKTINRK